MKMSLLTVVTYPTMNTYFPTTKKVPSMIFDLVTFDLNFPYFARTLAK